MSEQETKTNGEEPTDLDKLICLYEAQIKVAGMTVSALKRAKELEAQNEMLKQQLTLETLLNKGATDENV